MAVPMHIGCELALAREWPRLLAAAGLKVHKSPDALSGEIEFEGVRVPIRFKKDPDQHDLQKSNTAHSQERDTRKDTIEYLCSLGYVPEPIVSMMLRTFLASGARCPHLICDLSNTSALIVFDRPTCLAAWAEALSGVGHFEVDQTLSRPGIPHLPSGTVAGSPAPLRFSTGPALLSPGDLQLQIYLELRFNRYHDGLSRKGETFIRKCLVQLEACGGSAIVLNGSLVGRRKDVLPL